MELQGNNLHIARGQLRDKKLTHEKIVTVNKKIRSKVKNLMRLEQATANINKKAFSIEDMMESRYTLIRSNYGMMNFTEFKNEIKNKFKLAFSVSFQPYINGSLGAISIIFSIFIIFGEIACFMDTNIETSIKGQITSHYHNYWLFLLTLIYSYGIFAIHWSIFSVRIKHGGGLKKIQKKIYLDFFIKKIHFYI